MEADRAILPAHHPLRHMFPTVRKAFRSAENVNAVRTMGGEERATTVQPAVIVCTGGSRFDVIFLERSGTRWVEVRRTRLLEGVGVLLPSHSTFSVRGGTALLYETLPEELVSPPTSDVEDESAPLPSSPVKRRRVRGVPVRCVVECA